jgi:PAS domain S-box-containing protein
MSPPRNSHSPQDAEALRRKAEERVQSRQENIDELSDEDARALAHELAIHQEELKIQNESLREAEADLKELYERYRNLYEHAPTGYLSLDTHRVIRAANLTAATIFGRNRGELLGKNLESLATPEWTDDCYLHCKRALTANEPQTVEAVFARPDESAFWARLVIHPAPGPLTHDADVACLVAVIDISERKELEKLRREAHDQLEARVRERTAELREMTHRLMSAQADERSRIAQGLHDEVGQLLTACQIKLAGLGNLLPEDRQTEISEVEELLATAVDLIRDLIFELATPTLERAGFAAAARELCLNLQEREGLSVAWEEKARNHAVPKDIAACLYQCLRELLYNVARHAEADEATVYFECDRDALRLAVRDEGKGFDAQALSAGLTRTNGFGLHNIRERVESLGGEVEVDSIPGDGTRVEIRLPLSRPEEETKEDAR